MSVATDMTSLLSPSRFSAERERRFYEPKALKVPGLANRGPRVERYRVPAMGAIVVAFEASDRITLSDPEGLQVGELLILSRAGQAAPGILGQSGGQELPGLAAILAAPEDSARRLRDGLVHRGIDLTRLHGLRLFGGDSPAGAEAAFEASEWGLLVVAAPGRDMMADEQSPPTDLLLTLTRARPLPVNELPLPDPLSEPLRELRIGSSSAESYEIKAGEYIQIIDVAGRQCSDFQAFNRRPLDSGLERPVDDTVTRTLMGLAYPGPGLFSKLYDLDMQPLVELVQDTCGRHDTFGLACTAKYYDDMGYPGHVNCSDNFNGALEPFGIAPRAGWQAMNFFYNTRIDEHNVLYLDEPWSRPGDYVLMRALTDLVCVSSACPDDTSAANAWHPTDIHVRVYGPERTFSKAVAYRMTADAPPELTKETGFHPRTAALTRDFVEYRGYWLPNSYTNLGPIDEYYACREGAIAMDLSALRKFEVLGPDAEQLLQHCLTRNVRKLAVGQVVYSAMCYETGGMIDDGTLLRLGDNNFRWIGGDPYSGLWLRAQAEKLGLRAWVKSSTDQMHNLSVQGPKSREILRNFVWTPPTQPNMDELGWFRLTVARIGDHNGTPIVVSRTGYTGELGYEIWCHPKHAVEVWDTLFEAGAPHGIQPLGLAGLDILRIEAGLIFAGYEFCDQTDPFEAGVGFTVPLKSKDEDFIGREALIERKAHPQRKLVGLELDGQEPGAHGDCIHVGRAQVGVVTSATRSPILQKNIALARLDIRYTEEGTEVEVGKLDGHQKRIPARVVPFPFYDPKKERVRA